MSIDAVKRTRGDRSELEQVQFIVDDRAGRVDVRTEHDRVRSDRNRQGDHVSVDYTVVVPASASVDLHSISGIGEGDRRARLAAQRVDQRRRHVADAPKLEVAKTVSGSVSLTGITTDGDLTATSVSGSVHARGLKARGLDVGTVSGDISVAEAACERLEVKTVSGGVEYSGGIARGGRYEINSHSGTVPDDPGKPGGISSSTQQLQRIDSIGTAADPGRRCNAPRRRRQARAPRRRRPCATRDVRRRQRDPRGADLQR